MNTRLFARSKPALGSLPSLSRVSGPLLGRQKCACGGISGPTGECETCRKREARRSSSEAGLNSGPSVFGPAATRHFSFGQRFKHDLSQVPTRPASTQAATPRAEVLNVSSESDPDPIHSQLIEEFRERELIPRGGRDPTGAPAGPSVAQIKYGGLLGPCPQPTEVAAVIDLQSAALSAGFRTAYGIHAQMRVRPDARTWDGTSITESLTLGANNCPATLTHGDPCSGGSTFVVGAASGRSSLLPAPRPGRINRFWDFHVTHVRPSNVSVLHDTTRNPANLSTCSTVCNQEYRCAGNLIGRHVITRRYRKGTYNRQDVTLMDVTKT